MRKLTVNVINEIADELVRLVKRNELIFHVGVKQIDAILTKITERVENTVFEELLPEETDDYNMLIDLIWSTIAFVDEEIDSYENLYEIYNEEIDSCFHAEDKMDQLEMDWNYEMLYWIEAKRTEAINYLDT